MSEENVEIVTRTIDAWNRGDLDGVLAGAHPDLEWHPVLPAGIEGSGGVYRGLDGPVKRVFLALSHSAVV
jgi:ketosteroid isomerase-like protein